MLTTILRHASLPFGATGPFGAMRRASLLDMILPRRCVICHCLLGDGDSICGACWSEIKFLTGPVCRVSGTPLPYDLGDEHNISSLARAYPPSYDTARAAMHYDGKGAQLIRQMKFRDSPQLALLLARFMMRVGADQLQQANYILPVPLHWRRLLWRRFNQSAELARALSSLSGCPVGIEWLRRVRHTPQQLGLNRRHRQRNLRGAFAVDPRARPRLRGAHIVLVDDVMTTGTTVNLCASALRDVGVARIDVLSAARVVLPEFVPRRARPKRARAA